MLGAVPRLNPRRGSLVVVVADVVELVRETASILGVGIEGVHGVLPPDVGARSTVGLVAAEQRVDVGRIVLVVGLDRHKRRESWNVRPGLDIRMCRSVSWVATGMNPMKIRARCRI